MHWNRSRRIFKSKYPHFQIEKQPSREIWQATDDSFTKIRNSTYNRFVFFSSTQQKGESKESFYGHLIEQAEDCSLGDEETTLTRVTFILNINDHDTQRQLLKETVSPTKALDVAINMEMGAQNQQKIHQSLNTTAQSVNAVNNFQGRNRNVNCQHSCKNFTRYPTVPQNYQCASICTNCGQRWSHNHRQICPANGTKCNNREITGNFARKCGNLKKSHTQISKPPQKMWTRFIQTSKKAMIKNLSNI